ncbi:MAG: hypothetical protein JWN86_3891 [Planctomycetota bacterium]|nr:hypothetical protein [Planctomycetota bacterium]
MATVDTIPVTIHPDAAAFLEEIGQGRELEIMLEQAKRTIPALRSLDVVLHDFPETGPPSLTIDAHRDPLPTGYDWADQEFARWQVREFPPEVCQNFTLMSIYHTYER